jgi:hypothetical protein
MTRLNDGAFIVESMSGAERAYRVDPQAGTCTCPHFVRRLSGTGQKCKHLLAIEELAQPTALQKAAAKAAGLTDEQLRMWAAQYESGPVACACRLELASRKLQAEASRPQPKPIPAGVLVLLEGATEAERARALEIYR